MKKNKFIAWKSMLVCLDLSDADQALVEFAAQLTLQINRVQEVVLLHNIRFDFAGVTSSFSKTDIERLQRKIKKRLTETHQATFSPAAVKLDVVVSDKNSTTKAILIEAEQRGSSVILMGKKASSEGMGIIPQKVLATDQLQTPLLLVPTRANFRFRRIVAAVDLSEATRAVVQAANMFAQALLSTVTLFHVYKVPINYFPYLETSSEELSATLEQRAAKRMKEFQTDLRTPDASDWQIVMYKSANVSDAIMTFIAKEEAELLIVGRLGKTNLFGNNIGGVARTLLTTDVTVPICIV